MMKFLILSLTAILLFQTSKAFSYTMPYGATDNKEILKLAEQGKMSPSQFDEIMDIYESGGDVLKNQSVSIRDMRAVEEYRKKSIQKLFNKNIEAPVGIEEVQQFSMEKIVGYGDWAFEFVFIDKNGNEKVISSYNSHKVMRPGSTLKLFTAWAALRRGTYPVGNVATEKTMAHAMKWSHNVEADEMLRSVSRAHPDHQIPTDSYLHSVLGYQMDNDGTPLTIDQLIIQGCSILRKDYANLIDFSKFHQVNGSGLQDTEHDLEIHKNRVTVALEIHLLKKILASKDYDRYKVTLPSPGNIGTLKNSFEKAEFPKLRAHSTIYAKTGTLSKAKGLAGFVEISQGKIVFAILSDNLLGLTSKEALKGPIESIVGKNVNYVLDHAN
jgi:D-Ala-D-Ala carboxypeptidase 3 (S13) family